MVYTNMVYALQGTAENIIAIPPGAYSGWEMSMLKELAPELANVNREVLAGSDVNAEELAGLKPDLVICWDSNTNLIEQLQALGLTVVQVHAAKDLDTLKDLLKLLGNVLNCNEKAEQLLAWYDEVADYVDSKSAQVAALSNEEKPRVLNLTGQDLSVSASGVNAFITEWIGGQNIELTGASAETSTPTMEEILVYDPEVIFVSNWDDTTPEDLYENRIEGQDWSGVSAVKNHRVYKVPCGLYRWVPPNTLEKPMYVLWQASILHPDIFSEVDIRTEIKDFYKTFLDYDMTDAVLDTLLRTELNK
ncbi:MAG: ABC transporter substrate-binding protein [Peptococcaceae bacterium]